MTGATAPTPDLAFPMPREQVKALTPEQQRRLYIEGARAALQEAQEQGWFDVYYSDLSMIIDDLGDSLELRPPNERRHKLEASIATLACLEQSPHVFELMRNGVDVEVGDDNKPVFLLQGQVVAFEPIVIEKSADEKRAELIAQRMNKEGFYVETGGIDNLDTGTTKYYAHVIPQTEREALLIEANALRRQRDIDPSNKLPWETMVRHKGFARGHDTLEQALRAAAAPYMTKN